MCYVPVNINVKSSWSVNSSVLISLQVPVNSYGHVVMVASNFVELIPDIGMNDTSSPAIQHCLSKQLWFICRDSPTLRYRKAPKFSDTRKLCCSLPKIQIKMQNLRVFCKKDVNGKANSEDPDQTAPQGAV